MSLYDTPDHSPWGKVQCCKMLCPGAFEVSTASHGGVMVSRQIANEVLSAEARKCGFREGGYLCYEEDCDAPVALRELMDKNLFAAPVNDHFKPGEYSAVIDQSIQQFHPVYWAARERRQHKSSVKSRLTANPVQGRKTPSKSKKQEVR